VGLPVIKQNNHCWLFQPVTKPSPTSDDWIHCRCAMASALPTMESDLFFETDILISNIYFPVKAYVHHNSRSLDQFVPTIFWGPWFYLFNIWHMHVFICQAASNMVIHLQLSAFYWIGSRSWSVVLACTSLKSLDRWLLSQGLGFANNALFKVHHGRTNLCGLWYQISDFSKLVGLELYKEYLNPWCAENGAAQEAGIKWFSDFNYQ